ncbi:hypothetical protein RRG08_051552 [Elysia crispata]|uniref:Uncharacterized protein n=1 Tax=Elysia crispata TaxID=231223 RepID=A0AAE0Y189_9GAST|nr:hypothetical protein RRG08_051552 [Elysia crispata]
MEDISSTDTIIMVENAFVSYFLADLRFWPRFPSTETFIMVENVLSVIPWQISASGHVSLAPKQLSWSRMFLSVIPWQISASGHVSLAPTQLSWSRMFLSDIPWQISASGHVSLAPTQYQGRECFCQLFLGRSLLLATFP